MARASWLSIHEPARAPHRLHRVLGIVNGGPLPFYRAALVSLTVTSALVTVIALRIRPHGLSAAPQREMSHAALAVLCLSVALGFASLLLRGRVRPAWLDRAVAPQERAAIWLALAAWLPFLAIVAYYRAKATFPPSVHWINFGYDDKRWITAAYLLCALALMLFLVAAAHVLNVGRDHPQSWRAWFAGLLPRSNAGTVVAPPAGHAVGDGETALAGRRPQAVRILQVAAGIATALGLAYYFLGPPWYLSRTKSYIGYQEDVFLVGFQAITKGHLPYIGVAGVQYGPGTQLASYWFMRHVASFSLVGFREAWALFQWIGASILFVAFFLAFGYARGLAASLLSALVYPTLHQVAFQPGGSFDGFWAWANPLRYVGTITLVVLLPAAIRRCPSWRGVVSGFALGVVWGVMSYMAQENLIAGGAGALLVGALLLLTGTFLWRAIRAGLAAVLAGFVVVWLPVLGFYAVHGDLSQFLNLYFLSPRAVAQGYSDTSWQGASHKPSPLTTMFYALPFVLAVLGLLTVVQFRPFRIAAEWSRDRILLAAMVLVTILLYQGALLRSDTSHLTGTLLAVPALVVVASTVLPRLLGGHRRRTLIAAGAAIAAASFALLPLQAFTLSSVRSVAEAPYLDRQALAADSRSAGGTSLAARRVGAGLASARHCCQGAAVPMRRFIDVMNQLHTIIGSRTTYVVDVRHGYPGLVYFVADLTPAPVLFDEYTTVLNKPQLRAYMADFSRSVLPLTQALVTTSLDEPEARIFIQRYPNARRMTLHFAGQPYYVLLRPGTPNPRLGTC
jgi:hypothetical protein